MIIMKVFITHLDQNLMIKMINIKQKTKKNNIDRKPRNVFDYFKSLSQETKDLIDEIKDADDDTDNKKLLFIGSNKTKI